MLFTQNRHSPLQAGYTLIEVMIVIAIIGILASIALPAYKEYIARAQVMEGFTAASGLKTEIVLFIADKGRLPDNKDIKNKGAAAYIAAQAKALDGKYFDAGDIIIKSGGVIAVEFSTGANKGKRMILTPIIIKNDEIVRWKCAPGKPNKKAIDKSRLPSSCQ